MRPTARLALAVLVGTLVMLGQSVAPGQPVAAAPWTGPGPVVIFATGLNSDSDSGGALFYYLRTTLQALDPDTHSLNYSYLGGQFTGAGEWQPVPYVACDTHQSLFVSARELRDVVLGARDIWPDRKVAVVGHSLGGLIAMLEATEAAGSVADGSGDAQAIPDVVITLDAPLRGMSHPLAAIVRAQNQPDDCDRTAALDELAGLRDNDGAVALATGAELAVGAGAHVLMVANFNDSAFGCCLVDGRPGLGSEVVSQYLDAPGTMVWQFPDINMDLPNVAPDLIGATGTHHAALFNAEVVRRLAETILVGTE